jgi:hypothetical protein
MGSGNPGSPVSPESGQTYPAAPEHLSAGGACRAEALSAGGLTLDPIRTDGPDALDTTGIPEITANRLCQLEITADNPFHEVTIHQGTGRHASHW